MLKLAMIAAGGAFGSVLRYLVQVGTHRLVGTAFPIGTMLVNVVGCLGIGLVAGALSANLVLREEYRLGILVGVLGGFTTFSAFSLETLALAQQGKLWLATLNIAASCALCLVAVAAGFKIGAVWA